ncbi:MAG TPA: polysaccharide deacetylase family protein, partial [Flavisolibacter sp.]|nr:polysaccharide deacetylase family protein [Flavisolibacter sp.]
MHLQLLSDDIGCISFDATIRRPEKIDAKATFFCIGKNVKAHQEVYQQILHAGHAVGNHTEDHLNGWKTDDSKYLFDVSQAAGVIKSNLFRPPYGRIKKRQAKGIA